MFYSFVYKALSQQIEIMTRKLAAGVIFFFFYLENIRGHQTKLMSNLYLIIYFLPIRTHQRTILREIEH